MIMDSFDGAGGGATHFEHATPGGAICDRARYEFAANFFDEGALVLDNGCGIGRGSILLSAHGARVVGLDISENVVRNAADDPRCESVTFVVGNSCELPFPSRSFDCITCFEVIEHVNNPVLLLTEVRRVLRLGGVAVVSTPVRPPWGGTTSLYHVQEFDCREFSALIQEVFPEAELFRQIARKRWVFANIWLSRLMGILRRALRIPEAVRFSPRKLCEVLHSCVMDGGTVFEEDDVAGVRGMTNKYVRFVKGQEGPALFALGVCHKIRADQEGALS